MQQSMQAVRESLVLKRTYPVAPEAVWRAWIDADALRIWFGQSDAPGWLAELDVRVGGRYRFVMRDTRGGYYDAHGSYREVVPPRRLVFTWSWQKDADADALISVLLEPVAGGTELVFRLDPMLDPRERDAWRADFKRLGRLLQDSK